MINTNPLASRHYGDICHLIRKMEHRFGPKDEILGPFLCAKECVQQELALRRRSDRYESVAGVTRRYWASRAERMNLS